MHGARRKFVEALTANWWRARDAYMPDGPKTRDERYVWEALRRARTEDIWALEAKSPCLVIPCDPALQWENIEPTERIKMSEGDTVRFVPARKMTPEHMAAWLSFHAEWVAHEIPRVVLEAIAKIRAAKSDRRAERRRKMWAPGGRVMRNGRRVYVKPRGRKPDLSVKVRSVAKVVMI